MAKDLDEDKPSRGEVRVDLPPGVQVIAERGSLFVRWRGMELGLDPRYLEELNAGSARMEPTDVRFGSVTGVKCV